MGTTTEVGVEVLVDLEVKVEDPGMVVAVDGEVLVDPQDLARYAARIFCAHVSRITIQGRNTMARAIHTLYKIRRFVFLGLQECKLTFLEDCLGIQWT